MEMLCAILMSVGRIEGELEEIRKLNDRVRRLELWQFWLQGGLAALIGGYGYLFRVLYWK